MLKKFLSIAVICLGITISVKGDSFATIGDDHTKEVPLKKDRHRPTDEFDDENLTCVYVDGKLKFEFTDPEGNTTVDVSKLDTGGHITQTNNGYYFEVVMGDAPGFYEITVTTATGSIYSGFLSVD